MKTLSPALASDQILPSRYRTPLCRPCLYGLLFLTGMFLSGFAAAGPARAATPGSVPAASAASIIGNNAELNGVRMPAGATLFPGDVILVGDSSTAALRFGNDMVFAAANTELVVEADGVSLRVGFVQVRAGGAQPFAVAGPFFHLNVAASGGIPSSAEIRLGGNRAQVSAVAGAADLTAAGGASPVRLHAGETATLDAAGTAEPSPAQTAANPAAGEVSRLVPQVQIDRASQHIVASASDRVYWNDELRSGPTGRAHVTLKDGSQLNLGSDSSLRIVQHDAQAQQTSLDLLVGRLRAKIAKQGKPGSKFEVHTPMGIAGLVGTDFSLLVTDDYTQLMVFEGSVRFTPVNGQPVTVNAGMMVRISKAGVIDGPVAAPATEVQTAKDLTDIVGNAAKAPTGTVASPTVPLIITLSGAAAGVGIGVWEASRPTVSVSIP